MHRVLCVLLALLFAACSAPSSLGAEAPSAEKTTTPTTASTSEPDTLFPDFGTRLPRRAGLVAREIAEIQRLLPRTIELWLEEGGNRRSRLGREVHRGAIWHQRLYRYAARNGRRARRVLTRLTPRHSRILSRHVDAQQGLSALTSPVRPRDIKWETYRPESPHRLLRYYREGERRYDVPWEVLASVNAIETRFGRILGPSSAGARGPMQFMPATWDAYGKGDIDDPHDSIIAAARYLSASGAPERMRDALFA